MEYMKIADFKENKIIIKKSDKFVINNLMPVGFREQEKNNFIFLFLANQDFDDTNIYLQLFFSASNQFEYDSIKRHPNYIKNYKNNPDSLDMYKKMISNINKDNLYITDFYMTRNPDFPLYYNSYAYKVINDTDIEKMNIFIPRNTFVKLKCLLGNYNILSPLLPTSLMYKLNIQNIKFSLVSRIKNIGSTMVRHNEIDYIDTHYVIRADNKIYAINYRSKPKPHFLPMNIMGQDDFSKYKNDYYLEYIFTFEDKVYIIYPEENDNKVILIIDKDQINNTNFINPYNTIYKEEKRNESTENQ